MSGKGDQKASDKKDTEAYDISDTEASGQRDEKASNKSEKEASDKTDAEASGQRDDKASDKRDQDVSDTDDSVATDIRHTEASDKKDTEASDKSVKEASEKADTEASGQRDEKASDKSDKEAHAIRDTEASDQRDEKASDKREMKASDKNDTEATDIIHTETSDKKDTEVSGQRDEKASDKTDVKASDKIDEKESDDRDIETSGKTVTEAFGITDKITSVKIWKLASDKRATEEEAETVHSKGKTYCRPCQIEFKQTSANGICQECEEYMCSDCFSCHHKANKCRSHIFIEGTSPRLMKNIQENPEKCRRHNNEGIKFYYREHNAAACCDCIIFGHKNCLTEYITELSKNILQSHEMLKLKGKLEELNCSTITTEQQVKVNQNRCTDTGMRHALLNRIKTFRSKINDHLDREEQELIFKVNMFINRNDDTLSKLKNDYAQILSGIDDMKQVLDLQGDKLLINFVNSANKVPLLEQQLRCIQMEKS